MNILIFEKDNFGIEDVKECLKKNGCFYKLVKTEKMVSRVDTDFDKIFEREFDENKFDCVFTFNYSPVISNNCNKRNIPYIALVYDSPQVLLYSYTIINPCNYVFIFDKTQYMELKNEGINTVYYTTLPVNADRMRKMLDQKSYKIQNSNRKYSADISFVGSMYNEKHNLFDRLSDISDFNKGYLDAIMNAQRKVYGYFFLERLLKGEILEDMLQKYPVKPNSDGVETVQYLYANYFLARKMATDDRKEVMTELGRKFGNDYKINLYTPNETPELLKVNNCGSIDYYDEMPYVFRNSKINLNITLRSIKSGIPLRAMDIMGAGGFLISNYQEDFYDNFIPGEDMVMYESIDDLVNKCKYYLEHENERIQIASNGAGKVLEKHTYDVRFKEIFDIVFNEN
jgi:spore maturation protein CgeB